MRRTRPLRAPLRVREPRGCGERRPFLHRRGCGNPEGPQEMSAAGVAGDRWSTHAPFVRRASSAPSAARTSPNGLATPSARGASRGTTHGFRLLPQAPLRGQSRLTWGRGSIQCVADPLALQAESGGCDARVSAVARSGPLGDVLNPPGQTHPNCVAVGGVLVAPRPVPASSATPALPRPRPPPPPPPSARPPPPAAPGRSGLPLPLRPAASACPGPSRSPARASRPCP